MLRRRWGFRPLAAGDEEGTEAQGDAAADSAVGRLHGLRALCLWFPLLPPSLRAWPGWRPLLAMLAVTMVLALVGVARFFHALAPRPSPEDEPLNRTSRGQPLVASAHLGAVQVQGQRNTKVPPSASQGLIGPVPVRGAAQVRSSGAPGQAVPFAQVLQSIAAGIKGTPGLGLGRGVRSGEATLDQQLPVAGAAAATGTHRAIERALGVTGLPALSPVASSAPNGGRNATAEVPQGCWLPPGVAEAAQREALAHIWRQLSGLDAKAAAAEAAEVALGPAQAQELLQDMLAAEAAETGELRAGAHTPTSPGVPGRQAEEGGLPGGVEGEAPDPVCGAESRVGPSPFREAVAGRRLLLVMHEASLTGAPLAVAELAAQARACGARAVHLVLLNWQTRGGAARGAPGAAQGHLLKWLKGRGVSVLRGKGSSSFAAANASDVVILGSATCARWLRSFLAVHPGAASRVVWWLMENRRRYFDIAQPLLPRVAAAVFIAHSQAATWRNWSSAAPPFPAAGLLKTGAAMGVTADLGLALLTHPLLRRPLPECSPVVPLSLSPSLALLAGLSPLAPENSSAQLGGAQTTVQGTRERVAAAAAGEARALMRQRVRRAMGVSEDDTVVLCLSSVNPGKGQLGLLRATLAAWERLGAEASEEAGPGAPGVPGVPGVPVPKDQPSGYPWQKEPERAEPQHKVCSNTTSRRRRGGRLVLALGSMGCKSNKEQYLELLRSTITAAAERSPAVARMLGEGALLWLSSTLSVGPLYSAADVYVMNSQGLGETFGRVSVEAMAFELPVLGTSQGGTLEIVLPNATGLLHPVGSQGEPLLSSHLVQLHRHRGTRQRMGRAGQERAWSLFLGFHMYGMWGKLLQAIFRDPPCWAELCYTCTGNKIVRRRQKGSEFQHT